MEWVARLNAAMAYIEEHLDGEISYEQLGRLACCSSYHFQRMFGYMAGLPLSEYIRRRRMSRAAADLQSGQKIIDVAARYGYDSPTAFNRASGAYTASRPPRRARAAARSRLFRPSASRLPSKERCKWITGSSARRLSGWWA